MTTKIGQVAQELARLNPWWRRADWARGDADLRATEASGLGYRPKCLDDLQPNGLYLLRGPRRVGKTVSVKQAIVGLIASGTDPRSIVRVAADGWAANDLRTVVQNVALPPVPTGHHRWWFIDEVTAIRDDWATQVKYLRDNDPGFASSTVVLTGSNAAALTSAAGVLAGRRGDVDRRDRALLPIGFRTFAELIGAELPGHPRLDMGALRDRDAYYEILPWLDDLSRAWDLYLSYGGFPVPVSAARLAEPVPAGFVEDMFDVVFRDAFANGGLSVTITMALLARLGQAMASPANLSSVAADVGISVGTVQRHVRYLADAYLLWHCEQKAPQAWVGRHRAQDKLYFTDPVVARLPYLRNNAQADIDPSILTEMLVGMCIHRAAYAEATPWGDDNFLFHVRTPSRKEIDFISGRFAGVAVEVKFTEGGRWAGKAATVNASEWDGLVLTRNVLDCSTAQAWAVPVCLFAYLVDT